DDGSFALRTTVADISERKELERETILRSRLLDATTDAVLVHDLQGHFLYVNEAACRMHGYTRAELLALPLSRLDTPENAARIAERVAELEQQRELTFEVEHFTKAGSRIPIEIHASLQQLNGRQYIISVMRDIRERKAAEVAVQQARNDLLYAVSHDLKTPLMALNQSREMLNVLAPAEALARFQEYGEIWQRNLQRLERMINNLVDSQRGEEDHFPLLFVPCCPEEMVRRVVEDLTGYALALQVQFDLKLEPVPEGSCDQEALARVVENLLTNAVKFSPKGGRVEVRLRMEDQTLLLEVEDHGAGIPAQEQEQLFQPFQRGRSAQRKGIPGTGLGLYVCRRIMEAHGGSIALTSEEGKGTKVIVRLPWKQGAE
ncbi:MAG: PAS domain-containing sensor histidine kinase, partial [candidate division NC10 bacterium]